ncbi:MAG TPA: hypothetical protein VEF71_02860 [Streptosporangiaceae bacterium]|nr:hypothetical protein [Streptosporangiaceae bacterium]
MLASTSPVPAREHLQKLLPSRELAAGAAGRFAVLTAIAPRPRPRAALSRGDRAEGAVLGSGAATLALALLVAAIGRGSAT